MKTTETCQHCGIELPPYLMRRHTARCLVRLRRIGQPESAYQQFVRLVRGERVVRP